MLIYIKENVFYLKHLFKFLFNSQSLNATYLAIIVSFSFIYLRSSQVIQFSIKSKSSNQTTFQNTNWRLFNTTKSWLIQNLRVIKIENQVFLNLIQHQLWLEIKRQIPQCFYFLYFFSSEIVIISSCYCPILALYNLS